MQRQRRRSQSIGRSDVREDEWMIYIRGVARTLGYAVYHTHDSRRSDAGFPDLILCKGKYLLAVELKRDRKQRPTDEQEKWLRLFSGVTEVRAAVWTPEDRDQIYTDLIKFANDAYR
jgi:hypothetical protein